MKTYISYKRHLRFSDFLKKSIDYQIFNIERNRQLYSSSVRLGLLDIFDQLNIEKNEIVLLPSISPYGLILPLKRKKIKYEYYHVTHNFHVDIDGIIQLMNEKEIKCIFFIHYFGIYNDQIKILSHLCEQKNILLFEDCVQGMLSESNKDVTIGTEGNISFYSLPKYFPIPDGAVFQINDKNLHISFHYHFSLLSVFSNISHIISLLLEGYHMTMVSKFFYGLYYYLLCQIRYNVNMSRMSRRLITKIDVNSIIRERKKNFNQLDLIFKQFNLSKNQIFPPGYPLFFYDEKDKTYLKKQLEKNSILTLTYKNGWNYFPRSNDFSVERNNMSTHLLIPLTSGGNQKSYSKMLMFLERYYHENSSKIKL